VVPRRHRPGRAMILAFTDFGWRGPYLGEMRVAALRLAPSVPYVDLMADAPAFRPDLAAYHLAALAGRLAPGDVVLGVVDPGVGGPRRPLALFADGVWLVGPDNGLFELVMRRAGSLETHAIAWRPPALSASFHGRDLFAPTAARLALGEDAGLAPVTPIRHPGWPDEADCIVHVDSYGNLVSGRRAATLPETAILQAGGRPIAHARTFSATRPGELFWYANSAGLVEIAANAASAATLLGLAPGAPLQLQATPADCT